MQLIAATNNAHKLIEIQRVLQPLGFTVLSMQQAGLAIEPEETGATFAENARIKAQVVCTACGKPVIADDSGLCVDALQGAPGVYSARYAGSHGDDAANNNKLLKALLDVPQPCRTARFVSAVCLAMPSGRLLEVQGACEGSIGFAPKGENGFGYDPLFYVGQRSFAEFSSAEKDACSHRGAALAKLVQALPAFIDGEN